MPVDPQKLLIELRGLESDGYIKLKRFLGSWSITLTKRGRAALDIYGKEDGGAEGSSS
jgi:hypothetical protein